LKLVIINRHTRSSSASSDEEEKRRPFLSTLTSSLMLQEGNSFDSNEKNNFFGLQKKSQTIFKEVLAYQEYETAQTGSPQPNISTTWYS